MRRLHADALEILRALADHRLLTARQLHELCVPHRRRRWVERLLASDRNSRYAGGSLYERGLVGHVPRQEGRRERVWYLTPTGWKAVGQETAERREGARMSAGSAAGPRQSHVLATNEVGLAFLRQARMRGHECTWRHEVPWGRGEGGRKDEQVPVRSDAEIIYEGVDGPHDARRILVELDRGTEAMPILAEKMRRYARASLVDKAAQQLRADALVLVLDGRQSAQRLMDRASRLSWRCRQEGTTQLAQIPMGVVLLEDVIEHGPRKINRLDEVGRRLNVLEPQEVHMKIQVLPLEDREAIPNGGAPNDMGQQITAVG